MRRHHYNTDQFWIRTHAEQGLKSCFSLGRRLVELSLVSAEGLAKSLIQRVNTTRFDSFHHGAEYMGSEELDVGIAADQGFLEHPWMIRRSSGCWFDCATVMYSFDAADIGVVRQESAAPATPEQIEAFSRPDRVARRIEPPVTSPVPLPRLRRDSVRQDSGVVKLEELPQNLMSVPRLDGERSRDELMREALYSVAQRELPRNG